jgi:molybdopterin synthase catalytic subunit
MFCVFDTNSVFLTVCLQKINVTVTSYTSEVPLYKWNKILVADHLKVCLDYQKTEVEMFKQSIIYNTLSFVEPETYYKAKHLYAQDQEYSNKLGFVSTGGWIRNKLDHIHQGLDFEAYENKILTDLNEILKDEKHISLVIYPHPRELENCKGEELRNYYVEKLPDVKFEINNTNIASNQLFNETYLSICFISTLIFERFYAKRKSAIIYYKEDCFPLPYKSDFLAFVQNKTDFKKLIKETFHH